MVQSPSWEAKWFAASQEIPRISRNPKVHYRTHKLPPTVSILGHPNPVHTPTFHLLEIRPNIIHPSTPRSPQWSFSLRFPHQDPIHPPLLTHMRHMSSPSHTSRFYHPHNIGLMSTNHLAPRSHTHTHTHKHYLSIYLYIYTYVCVCVCLWQNLQDLTSRFFSSLWILSSLFYRICFLLHKLS